MLKKTSDVSIVSPKTKSKPKTFQTSEKAMLSETDSFDKIFMALWIEKLVANSLQTSTEGFEKWELVAYFEFKLRKIVFQISNPVSSP